MKKNFYIMAVMLIICFVIIGLQQREIKILNATLEVTNENYRADLIRQNNTLIKIDSLIRKKIEWYENERTELYGQIKSSNKHLQNLLNIMEETDKRNQRIIATSNEILRWGSK